MPHHICLDIKKNQPSGQIIQMGYLVFRLPTFKVVHTRRLLVNPKEMLNPDISRLYGVDDFMISSAPSVEQAYRILRSDIEKHRAHPMVVQWGPLHHHLRENLGVEWEEFAFAKSSIDVQTLFYAFHAGRGKAQTGLENALGLLNMCWDAAYGFPNDALADAHNSLLIYRALYNKLQIVDKISADLKSYKEAL